MVLGESSPCDGPSFMCLVVDGFVRRGCAWEDAADLTRLPKDRDLCQNRGTYSEGPVTWNQHAGVFMSAFFEPVR